ncbi:MAG: 4'-phosphopantetheinyl transferase superfamily protein [Polyangiaceae bacterium]|nr:4'-phosphopantetheinyl transferase superfamily protein [Polyangiaceae bacterium]
MAVSIHDWKKVDSSTPSVPADVELWFIHPCPSNIRVSSLIKERFSQNPDLKILKDEYGKPFITPSSGVVFSGAHCGLAALLAIGKDRTLGVDIEKNDPRRFNENIPREYFTNRENEFLGQLPLEQKIEAFFHIWTCKEAVIKATGLGTQLPLEHIEIAGRHPKKVALFNVQRQCFEAGHLELHELLLPNDYIGYVASGPSGTSEPEVLCR